MCSSRERLTAAVETPDERRFSSAARISISDSSRRARTWSSRSSAAGGIHAADCCAGQKRAINPASTTLVFSARQAGGGERSDGCRINEADHEPGILQKQSERFAVRAGRFQAGAAVSDLMRGEPTGELLEAVSGVLKNFVFGFAVRLNQTHIELQFGNVNARCCRR